MSDFKNENMTCDLEISSIWGSVFDPFWIPKSINIQFSYSTGSQNSLLCWPLNCQDLSSTKHSDVLRRFTTSLSSPLCSTWIGNVIRLSFLPPLLACSVYMCNPEAPGVICVRCQVHGQEQGNNQDQEGGDQTAERASDTPPTATGEVWLVHWYPIIQPRSAELARQPQSFFTQTAPFHLLPFPLCCSVCLPPSLLCLVFLSGIWVTAQAPRGFLWQMSSSMPWSLLPANQCVPPQWTILTHQHPLVEQQDNNCHHQGEFYKKKKPEVCVRLVQRRWRWMSWRLDGAKKQMVKKTRDKRLILSH